VLERFGSQDLAMVAAASAALGVSPPAAEQRAFLARSTAVLRASAGAPASGVPGMELAHLSHGLAAWGATVDGEWEGHFWAQVEARAGEAVEAAAEGAEAEAEEAEEEKEEDSFLEEAAQARRAGRGLTGRELSNLARNAVRLGLRPPPSTLRAMQEAAMGSVRSSSPRELALTQWGLTRLGAKAREDLLDAVCGEARRGLADWGITELSMLLWSLAELRHRPSDAWLAACAARAAPALRSASPLALANVAWAHAVLDWAPPSGDDWRQALSEGVQRCLAERLPLPEAARLVWSCTILQLYELPCLPPLWRHMLRLLVPGGGRGVEACIMHECSLLAAAEAPGLLTPPPQQLAAAAAAAWATQGRFIARAPTSTLQKRVRAVLHNRLQLAAESTTCERSGWGVDLALPQAGSLRLALQVDGPARFTSNTWQCVGSTRARDRALRAAGWTVLSLPFFTLDAQQGGAALAIYLKRRLAETANAHIEATRRAEAEARPKAAAQGPRPKPKVAAKSKAAAVPSAR